MRAADHILAQLIKPATAGLDLLERSVKATSEAAERDMAELKAETEEKATAASESLKAAVDAESQWWEWYWATKKEREAEAARKLEEERAAELKRLRERYLK